MLRDIVRLTTSLEQDSIETPKITDFHQWIIYVKKLHENWMKNPHTSMEYVHELKEG